MRTLFMGLWICSNLVLTLAAIVMIVRKSWKAYPIFFSYVAYSAGFVWLNLALYYKAGEAGYIYAYWVSAVGYTALAFAVLREVFVQIFRPYASLREFGVVLFRWATLVLILIGIVMTVSSSPGEQSWPIHFLMTMDRSIMMMQCGLVIFMFLFAGQLGLTLRHHLFGIAIGFGLMASSELIFTTLYAYGTINPALVNFGKLGAEILAYAVWTGYMFAPEPERRQSASLAHAANWNNELTGATYGNSGSAFLPNIVDTVERVLSKRTATEIYLHTAGSGPSLPN